MAPRKRKAKRYSVRIGGKLIQEFFTTAKDGRAWQDEMRRQRERMRAGLSLPFQPVKIEDHAADFINGRQSLVSVGIDDARMRLYLVPPFLGRELHTITRKEWKQVFDWLREERKLEPKTINNIRGLVHRMYEDAIKHEPPRALENPIKHIPRLKTKKEMRFFHTAEECVRYLEAAAEESSSIALWAYFALNTGAREGEVISLSWADVNVSQRWVHIWRTWDNVKKEPVPRTKTNTERKVGMNDALAAEILRHRNQAKYTAPSDWVIHQDNGKPVTENQIWDANKRIIARAGLPYVHPHGLRHTFATQYLQNGGNIWDLSKILGHASVTQTEKYAHAVPARVLEKAQVFEVRATPVPEIITLRERGKK